MDDDKTTDNDDTSNMWQNSIENISQIEEDLNTAIDTGEFILTEMDRQKGIMDSIRDRLSYINDYALRNGNSALYHMSLSVNQYKYMCFSILIILFVIFFVIVFIKYTTLR